MGKQTLRSSLAENTTTRHFSCDLSVASYQKNDWCPARQSFFWYDNDKDLKVGFPLTWLIILWVVHPWQVACLDLKTAH